MAMRASKRRVKGRTLSMRYGKQHLSVVGKHASRLFDRAAEHTELHHVVGGPQAVTIDVSECLSSKQVLHCKYPLPRFHHGVVQTYVLS
eukprot:1786518-Prymnesium_polylepis.2